MGHSMKILVAGAGGPLSRELSQAARERGVLHKGLDNPPFDKTDQSSIEEALGSEKFTLVVHATGYTEVDRAESEREIAFAANSDGPGYLARACARKDIRLLHVSTNCVSDGLKKTPYVETDTVCPISYKCLRGEQGGRRSLGAIEPCQAHHSAYLMAVHHTWKKLCEVHH